MLCMRKAGGAILWLHLSTDASEESCVQAALLQAVIADWIPKTINNITPSPPPTQTLHIVVELWHRLRVYASFVRGRNS